MRFQKRAKRRMETNRRMRIETFRLKQIKGLGESSGVEYFYLLDLETSFGRVENYIMSQFVVVTFFLIFDQINPDHIRLAPFRCCYNKTGKQYAMKDSVLEFSICEKC